MSVIPGKTHQFKYQLSLIWVIFFLPMKSWHFSGIIGSASTCQICSREFESRLCQNLYSRLLHYLVNIYKWFFTNCLKIVGSHSRHLNKWAPDCWCRIIKRFLINLFFYITRGVCKKWLILKEYFDMQNIFLLK